MKIIVFVANLCLVLCWCLSYFFFLIVQSHPSIIGDFVSNQFIILINKTQHGRINRSAVNSSNTADQAEQSVDRKRWLGPSTLG